MISLISMRVSFKCFNHCKIVFDHLRLSFQKVYAVFMCKMCIKYKYASPVVCACAHVFRKRPGCALTGACVLIRTNTAVYTYTQNVCANKRIKTLFFLLKGITRNICFKG